jgi:hypothetical protein
LAVSISKAQPCGDYYAASNATTTKPLLQLHQLSAHAQSGMMNTSSGTTIRTARVFSDDFLNNSAKPTVLFYQEDVIKIVLHYGLPLPTGIFCVAMRAKAVQSSFTKK